MQQSRIAESDVEEAAMEWLRELKYEILFGPDIAPDMPGSIRESYSDIILVNRFRSQIKRINPLVPPDAIESAVRKITHPESPVLTLANRTFHQYFVNGVTVEYRRSDGSIAGDIVNLVDWDHPESNDWLAINQYTVIEGQKNRRPDIVIFLNGLPVVVLELKNPADENTTIWSAFNQIQTYKSDIPSLFTTNELLIISDGLEARIGSLTADRERFMPWRTIEGEDLAPSIVPELEVLIKGALSKKHLLALLRHFIVYDDDGHGNLVKIVAGYHQFHAVRKAIRTTIEASRPEGDKRCGVVWHTQGSGKSLTMLFYAGEMVLHPGMENPTILVLTDRNDLDGQLFGTFSRCHEILRQVPVQATSRSHLRELLNVASGGVIFTTIQKFFPEQKGDHHPILSNRHNIIVIADEAHRTQYDFIDGFARHMRDALPRASFIGFTGTPIELTDKNTRAVFGDYISIYDIQQAVIDGATVPIYFESRLAKIELSVKERPKIDERFEEVTEGEEIEHKERLKTKWAALEALVGTEKRLNLISTDFITHWDKRLEVMNGKAMFVCMSRRICVELYNAIIKQRPEWHDEDDTKGNIKIVMTGSASDPLSWQQHIRNKTRRDDLAKRFRNPDDPFKIVIVRDMWLTGFDAPCLHTMYLDKPMHNHGLMQAIARVNRVFRDKPGGLVVDYIGLADSLRKALANYTASGGTGKTAIDQKDAVAVMLEKYEICLGLFHGFNWASWTTGTATQKLSLIPLAQEHVLAQEEGKDRLLSVVTQLSQAFALAVPHEETTRIRDDVAFFQAVRAALAKAGAGRLKDQEEIEHAIRQLVSAAITPEGVVDIFQEAGLKKPDISILSEEFLAEVRGLPQRNLAFELLQKLLREDIRIRSKRNVVEARSFAGLLERAIRKYQNRAIETAQVIEELIELARKMRESDQRGETLGLKQEEIAFYDALATSKSAVEVLGDEKLRAIAQELVEMVKNNVTIDWTVKESVRAKLRVYVKRILKKHGYPPDQQEQAVVTVLEQAEVLCGNIAG